MPDVTTAETDIARDKAAAAGWCVVGDGVYDLSSWSPRHPGGDFLQRLSGVDATPVFALIHSGQPAAERMLARLRVGKPAADALTTEERAWYRLRQYFTEQGWYRYRAIWHVWDALEFVTGLALGFALLAYSQLVAIPVLSLHVMRFGWWVHDIWHDSVFARSSLAKKIVNLVGIVVHGTLYAPPAVEHRYHHAFTNVIGVDRALETGPIIWDQRMIARSRPGLLRVQTFLWLGVVLPFAFFFIVGGAILRLPTGQRIAVVAVLAVRWYIVVYWLLDGAWLVALAPVCIGYTLLAGFASLNHFHLPMTERIEGSWVRSTIASTQNIRCGPLWSWLCGGLNYHIEHHLFPDMPRRNYPLVAPYVRELCREAGLVYRECSRLCALANLLHALSHSANSHAAVERP